MRRALQGGGRGAWALPPPTVACSPPTVWGGRVRLPGLSRSGAALSRRRARRLAVARVARRGCAHARALALPAPRRAARALTLLRELPPPRQEVPRRPGARARRCAIGIGHGLPRRARALGPPCRSVPCCARRLTSPARSPARTGRLVRPCLPDSRRYSPPPLPRRLTQCRAPRRCGPRRPLAPIARQRRRLWRRRRAT